ncbi:MAG: hypothetical protein LIQ31_07720 [Planctomycetes bacterium]|nr:hypothetical protein [Planctomycetota bacterium]
MNFVLAVDLGTSGCRSAVYDENLRMISCAKVDIALIVRSDTEIEQDAEAWWRAVGETVREAVAACDAGNIRALAMSAQGISVVPVDKDGHVLANALSWLDSRATRQLAVLLERYGEQPLYRRTGLLGSPLYTAAKLMWMREQMPDIMDRAHKILLPLDFVQYRLTGEIATNHTMAGGTMLYNLQSGDWDDDLLTAVGVNRNALPKIRQAGTPLGDILPDVAREWGLPAGVRVAIGAQDQKCAAHGAGVAGDIAAVSLGTASCISRLIERRELNGSVKIPCFPYLRGDVWDLEGIVNTGGSAFSWFRDVFAPGRSFDDLTALAEIAGGPGIVNFYPYLARPASPHWGEGTGMFSGLTLGTDLGQCARAVLEGVAYRIRENIDAMDSLGRRTRELRLFGGAAASDLWCRIIADAVGRPVARMASPDAALQGAAKLAFESVGIATPPAGIDTCFEPDAAAAARYAEAFHKYERDREKFFA